MRASKSDLRIRRTHGEDAARLAELSGQLGYPASAKQMRARLREVLKDRDGACFVAETRDGLTGWGHVSTTPLLEVERRAEVNGLVVEEKVRSQGTGALLLLAAEKWAKGMNCQS